ncbi:hypothetical protein HK098_003586 [Nowakowskiella sp. JEL0407]|nr:hypothetical protein HK098_003586 [Nowakowskiella sp. JEL0407]
MSDIVDLTESNDDAIDTEALMQIIEFTGADFDIAKTYLQVSDGNPEAAIALYLENGGRDLSAVTRPPTSSLPQSSSSQFNSYSPRAPIAPTRDVLYGGGGISMGYTDADMDEDEDIQDDNNEINNGSDNEIQVQERSALNPGQTYPMGGNPNSVGTAPRRAPPMTASYSSFFDAGSSFEIRSEVNSRNQFAESNSKLAELFSPPTDIMFKESFDRARESAQIQKKLILVTIQDPTEFVCQMMIRDLWRDQSVKETIKANFLFLFYNSTTPEGKKHKTFYPFTTYPYTAIIDPLTGERIKIWDKIIKKEDFLVEVADFVERRGGSSSNPLKSSGSSSDKKNKKKSVSELSEEEQIAMAMAQSIGEQDMDEDDANYVDDEEVDEDTLAAIAAMESAESKDPFDSIEAIVRDEPTTPDTVRIQFRWPDGTRAVRKFKRSDTVRSLFEYAKAAVTNPDGLKFELYNFRDGLISKLDSTLEECKLGQASLTLDFLE